MKRISKTEAAAFKTSLAKLSFFSRQGPSPFAVSHIVSYVPYAIDSLQLRLYYHPIHDSVSVYWRGFEDNTYKYLGFYQVLELIDREDFKIEMLYYTDLLDV